MVSPTSGPPGDPAIIHCVMSALRDGNPGKVSWSQLGPASGGSYGQDITILPGRNALRESSQQNDLAPPNYSKDGPSALNDAAFFDTCANAPDSATLIDCLQKAVVGCP